MEYTLIKTGGCSVVLGRGHYSKFVKEEKGKLLKLINTTDIHDEFKHLSIIRKIDNYDRYYAIPDELLFLLKPEEAFYKYCQKLVRDAHIFQGCVKCAYIDYAGSKDMLDTLNDIIYYDDYTFWYSYKKILRFIKHIMTGLMFIHTKKICHLDIKPENIMINLYKNSFKLIDFGFSSMEPFDDYIMSTKGTPGYFPKNIPEETATEWLPEIKANDMLLINGTLPMISNRKLVYKQDSYSLGRVLYFLKRAYDKGRVYECFNYEKKKGKKIDMIIRDLTENDVYKRITITDCIHKYFV